MSTLLYVCAACGDFAHSTDLEIDSGTTLTCDKCGKPTIVDLDTPDQRAKRYSAAMISVEALRSDNAIEAGQHAEFLFDGGKPEAWSSHHDRNLKTLRKRGLAAIDAVIASITKGRS